VHLQHDVQAKISLPLWLRHCLLRFSFHSTQCESNVDVWFRIGHRYVDIVRLNAEETKERKWEQGFVRGTAFNSR